MNTPTKDKYANATDVAELSDGYKDCFLKHNADVGFFIEFWIFQRREKRSWETISWVQVDKDVEAAGFESPACLIKSGTHRMLETYRPISRDQAIRLFLDGYDDVDGMMTVISDALDRAGVAKLEAQFLKI